MSYAAQAGSSRSARSWGCYASVFRFHRFHRLVARRGGAAALLSPPESPREAWLVCQRCCPRHNAPTVSPMFTIVIHAHVTCTCTCFHAHERPGIRRSREIGTEIERGGQYACTCTGVLVRLEAHHRFKRGGQYAYACFHQLLYSFCTVSVIPFALTSRERCQLAAWSACHVCCFRPPGGRPSCASADSVVLLSVHSTEFVLGLPRLLP